MANSPAYATTVGSLNSTAATVDLYRENIQEAPGTYSSAQSDVYKFNTSVAGVPTNTAHVPLTPYSASTNRVEDSWIVALRGAVLGAAINNSPTNRYETS